MSQIIKYYELLNVLNVTDLDQSAAVMRINCAAFSEAEVPV